MANQNPDQTQTGTPHFTKELLAGSLKHLRGDLEASISGEADDERARSRLEGARRLGLNKLAEEAISIMKQAEEDVHALVWPGGLDARYLALAGVIETLAKLSTQLLPHDSEHAHVTDLVDVISRIRLASGSNYRTLTTKSLRGLCVAVRTESEGSRDPTGIIQQVLAGGATTIRLMPGSASVKSYRALARWAATTCHTAGASVICDGRPDIVRATHAHGVRLDPNDIPLSDARAVLDPWQIVGLLTATTDEAVALVPVVDFIAIGPIFPNRDLPDQATDALKTLRETRSRIPADGPPLMVAGGLTEANVALLAEAGADGVCVGTAITDDDHPEAATRRTLATFLTASEANRRHSAGNGTQEA